MSKTTRKPLTATAAQDASIQTSLGKATKALDEATAIVEQEDAPEPAKKPAKERGTLVCIHMPERLAKQLTMAAVARKEAGIVKTRASVSQYVVELLMEHEADIKDWARKGVSTVDLD